MHLVTVIHLRGFIYESCANDCSGAQQPTIAISSLLDFPATEEFYNL
jgi:hypothetical protein